MARARKRHVQVPFEFRTWGGKRKGAGRKQVRARKSEPHRRRPAITAKDAAHVSLPVAESVSRMRRRDAYQAIRGAMGVVLRRSDFRIVHACIQSNHLHLIVEAENEVALARGIQAFSISAAKRLNAVEPRRKWNARRPAPAVGDRPSRRARKAPRQGPVFVDRYHAEIITTPRRARHALAYVLNNWRRHREDKASFAASSWHLDPFSSGVSFTDWAEGKWDIPPDHDPLPVCAPQTWLLRESWKKWGAISAYEVPGPRP